MTHKELLELVNYDPAIGIFTSKPGNKYSNQPVGARLGTLHKTKGYRYITILGQLFREHRLAFFYMTGSWPKYQIDHINNNKSDNRWENLRDVPAIINCRNRPMFKNNTSGHRGVVWNKQCNKWQVICRSKGVQHYFGLFEEKQDAIDIANKFYNKLNNNNDYYCTK